MYKQQFACIERQINCNQFYTVIFTNYLPSMLGRYKATFECDKTMTIGEIKPEGYDLNSTEIKVCF